MNYKKKIIDILQEVSYLYKILGDTYRSNAYKNAVRTIETIKEPIRKPEQLKGKKRIGARIYKKIEEIIDTGDLKKLKELRRHPHIKLITDLKRLVGFSSRNIDALLNTYKINKISDIRKIKEIKLTNAQKLSLKYYRDILKNIDRNDAKRIGAKISSISRKIDPNVCVVIAGSYRRGKKTSKDIDILISNTMKKDFMNELADKLNMAGIYSVGKSKIMGLIKDHNGIVRHIDLILTPIEDLWPALMHFTGSGGFNQWIRGEFKKKGWKLSEKGLFNNKGKKMKIESEGDIFDYLGIDYIPVKDRI